MKPTSAKPILLMRYGLIAFGVLAATHGTLLAETGKTENRNKLVKVTYNSKPLGENFDYAYAGSKLAYDVTGKVTDSKGQSLPGVNIIVKDTQKGTSTNASGEFSISVDTESDILVFSFIGYKTQQVTVGNQKQISVTLEEDTNVLNEVVVTALGISREKKHSGILHNRLKVM
ncbi:carboxypeptidase-like regulatory domain-containing protein [Dyadobacter sp. NIV53]|uniref:carboxypeptidase-like regulatory domain-containing protein n=1 Tax=Dyadobacter sp. NIV53 TaxID=2861765 RepID=UPI001C87B599|nr:carboxypeptidase-like regulatory domain-containing protein [Dyadobacter sp. NIV53]